MYAMIYSTCIRCHKLMGYNPHLVPSIRVTPDSPKEPLCNNCHTALNNLRKASGLEPWPDPLPGAYEACDENEL